MDINGFKQRMKSKTIEAKTKLHVWYIQHEQAIWFAAPVVIPAIIGGVKAVSKSYNAHMDDVHRKLTQYDPATGYYNQLRRELTSQDWDRIMKMKRDDGITITECLIRLNLIK